jgi:hypothetical protein
MIGPQTGGATSLWVKDPNGDLVVNDSLTPNTEPPSPPGYYGFYELSFPMSVNGTYQVRGHQLLGSEQRIPDLRQRRPRASAAGRGVLLMTFFGFLVIGLYFLGKISRKAQRSTLIFQGCIGFVAPPPETQFG